MPNGGVPRHMILTPRDGEIVIHCEGTVLHIIRQEDWAREKATAQPITSLSPDETLALVGFLQYWQGDRPTSPCNPEPGVKAEFDY